MCSQQHWYSYFIMEHSTVRRSEKRCIKKCILFRNFKHKVHTRRQTNYLSRKWHANSRTIQLVVFRLILLAGFDICFCYKKKKEKIESQWKENMFSHTIFLFVTNQEALMSRIWDTGWNGLKVTYSLKKLKTKNAWRRNQQTSSFFFFFQKNITLITSIKCVVIW